MWDRSSQACVHDSPCDAFLLEPLLPKTLRGRVEPTTGRLRALATALNTTPEALRDAGAASGADEPVGGGG